MRIVVVSDIHSNLLALDAVLAKVGAVDAIWHLGDVVGYGPEPDGVVDRLKTLGAIGVRGNHDAAATGGSEIDWFNPEAKAAMEWTRTAISETTREWLAALPLRRLESDFTLVHGSPRDPIWEYVTSAALARAGLSAISTEHGLHGHTHVPIAFTMVDGRMRTLAPRAGNTVALGEGRMLPQPGLGRPAARRRPAGELHGPRQRGRDRDLGARALRLRGRRHGDACRGPPDPARRSVACRRLTAGHDRRPSPAPGSQAR